MRRSCSPLPGSLVLAAVAVLAAGCSNPDTVAPPAPFLEATPKLTSLPTVVLAGVAEYGSKITVEREPAFGSGETAPGAVADLITGRFRFDAPLAAGAKNTFSLKATDAAGNASPAAVVEVLHEVPRPRFVRLTPTSTVIDTDGGRLTALLEVRHGEAGVAVEGMQVVLTVTGYAHAIAPVTAAVNAAGFAEVAIDGFDKVGTGTLVATAVLKAPDGSAAGDSRGFAVLAGRPASATLLLQSAAPGAAAPAASLTITAGTDVTASVSVSDAHGNTLIAPPLTLVTDASRAIVAGSTLSNLTEAGSFHVFARLSQSLLATSAALVVQPGPAAQVTLSLSTSGLVAGQPLTATGRALDSFGNPRAEPVALAETVPAWSYGGASDPQDFTGVTTSADGATSGTLVPRTSGSYEATATLSTLVAHAAFAVRPAALATFDFNLGAGPHQAADVVPFTYAVRDAFGNDTRTPVSVDVNEPSATVAVDGTSRGDITGLVRAGTYSVRARPDGWAFTTTTPLVIQPGPAAQVTLTSSGADLVAGQTLTVTGRSYDSYGNLRPEAVSLTENVPAWSYGGASDPQDLTGVATTAGATSGTMVPRTSGTFEATATLGALVAHAAFSVRPAALASFDFNLVPGTYKAADVVPFTYAVRDAFGNDTHTPLVVTVNAPAAVVSVDGAGQGEISGIVRSGAYSVVARAVGSAFVKTVPLNVEVAPTYGFNLILSAPLITEGSRVLVSLFDGYGNALDIGLVDLFIDNVAVASVPTVALSGRELTFNVAGTYHVKAQLKANAAISDLEILSVQGVVDTLPPTAVIQSIAFPAGTDVATRGFISAVVAFADNKSLAEGELVAQFGDSPSCTSTTGRLILSGLTASSPQVTLRAPACALPLDKITLVARVLDQAGNVAFSPTNTHLRMTPLPGFDFTAAGYTAATIGYGNRLNNNGAIADLAVDPGSETVFVTQPGNGRVVVLFPDRTQADLRDSANQPYPFTNPLGIATSRLGNIWVGDALGGASELDIVPASLGPAIQPAVSLAQSPGRLGIDEQGSIPMVCAPLTTAGTIRCWKTDAVAAPAQLFSTNVGGTPVAVSIRAGASPRLFWVDQACGIKSFPLVYGANTVSVGAPTTTFLAPGQGTCTDLAVLPSGDVAIVDTNGQRVLRVLQNGTVSAITTWNGSASPVAVDFANNRLFVLDDALNGVFALTATTTPF